MPPSKEFMQLIEKIRNSERVKELLNEIEDLHKRKNAGYSGDSGDPWFNFRQALLFDTTPFKGCLIRMSDKWSRISSLVKNPNNEQVGESLIDTLMDNAVYSLIAICLFEEEREEKRKQKEVVIDGTIICTDERIICTEKTDIENSNEYSETKIFLGERNSVE